MRNLEGKKKPSGDKEKNQNTGISKKPTKEVFQKEMIVDKNC